ncbi:MAG: DUF4390 domain-containing protein [Candidatus Methylumidiphilus sp.]
MTAVLRGLAVSAWLALLPAPAVAADYGFRILRAELSQNAESAACRLDADIDYRFSEPAIDALRNGVSLTLDLRLRVERERGLWWDETVLDGRSAFRIRYHALSKLFQMVGADSEIPRNFASINALLEAMGAIRGLPFAQQRALPADGRYRASLSVALDIESLPLPLRPVAYLTPAWHLHSPVYAWAFAN